MPSNFNKNLQAFHQKWIQSANIKQAKIAFDRNRSKNRLDFDAD